MQPGEHHGLGRHRLQIVLVALTQLGADLRLRFAHILNHALDRNNPFQIKWVYVIYAWNGYFGVGLLHDSLNGVAAFSYDASDQIVVRQDLQRDFTGNVRGKLV